MIHYIILSLLIVGGMIFLGCLLDSVCAKYDEKRQVILEIKEDK